MSMSTLEETIERISQSFHPELKTAYLKLFGQEAWQLSLRTSFRYLDSDEKYSWFWIYPSMMQSLAVMCAGMIYNHGLKAAHPPPSIVASGTFVLSPQAMKDFQSPQKIFPL